jgi:hypothetical protein
MLVEELRSKLLLCSLLYSFVINPFVLEMLLKGSLLKLWFTIKLLCGLCICLLTRLGDGISGSTIDVFFELVLVLVL